MLYDTNSIQCQVTETNTVTFCNDIHQMGIKNKTKQNKNNDTLGTDKNNQIWKKINITGINYNDHNRASDIYRKNRPISRDFHGEKSQNSRKNRPISPDFSKKKSNFEGFSGPNS